MTAAAPQRSIGGDRRKVVLIVEDDEDAGDLLSSFLEDAHYGVLRARDGAEALRVLGGAGAERGGEPGAVPAKTCNLILLDLMMPVMNGWDFRRKQRASPELAGIPVLLMSAGAHIAAVSGELEAAGFMAKPVEIADLLAKVKKHCT
jgi:DNA-binding response OmpR family regulator